MPYAMLPPSFHERTVAIAISAPLPPASWRVLPWLLTTLIVLAAATGLNAQIAINSTGAAPNPGGSHAILDISSTNKGILAPRISSAQRANLTGSAVDGLLVYQTDSVALSPRGYWYWDASTPVSGWRHLAWGGDIWRLGGNAGTTNANFLGTTNNMPLVFRTNNQERGRITETGQLLLYYTTPNAAPNEVLEVQGAIKLTGGNQGNTEGNIRFTPAAGGSPGKFEGNVVNTAGAGINGWKQIDNNFGERKIQESPIAGVSCQPPTSTVNPDGMPRKWPIPGPTAGPYASLTGPQSPYWGLWEDSHRQWLFRLADLSATGMCPGSEVQAIAFQVTSVTGGPMRLHFLRFSLRNTATNSLTSFDPALINNDSYGFAQGTPPNLPGPPPSYSNHNVGYMVLNGWNVHNYNASAGGPNFIWAGSNILLDASVDNQDWGSIQQGTINGYNSGYPSMVSVYCDACGGLGGSGNHFSCKWKTASLPAGFYAPPTTPRNGVPTTIVPNQSYEGWSWTGGWDLTGSTIPELCDGGSESWNPVGSFSQSSQLPRVAFLIDYSGGGAAFNVSSYMVAEEGVMIGTAPWAAQTSPSIRFRGPGTISAQKSVWSGTSLLSDYVFDLYYDGQSKPEDAKGAGQYVRTPLKDLPNFVERERHLPTIDGRDTWNKTGTFSVDKLGNQLWVTVEDQSLYIQELNARMDALQKFLVDKKLKELEGK